MMNKWGRKAFIILNIVVLLSLFAVMIPADAAQFCREQRVSTTVSPKNCVGPIVTPYKLFCFTLGGDSYCLHRIATCTVCSQTVTNYCSQYCKCTSTGKWQYGPTYVCGGALKPKTYTSGVCRYKLQLVQQ